MRPGQTRPGDLGARRVFIVPLVVASMRPGQTRPGDGTSPPRTQTRRPRFNEAGADSPRRCGALVLYRNYTKGASMRPGQTRPGDEETFFRACDPDIASMRPGQTRPGDPPDWGQCRLGTDSFNEAGADSPRRSSAHARWSAPVGQASMRPGQTRPGDRGGMVCPLARRASFNEAGADSPRR